MKRVLPEYLFSDEQLNRVKQLSAECGLCEETVKILYGRGLRDKDAIFKFMHPSEANFISPFKMSGMQEAVELITLARDEEWGVVVFGDYDADGICASTIMGKVLRDFGIEPVVCVPERNSGYGLSKGIIDQIFDEYFPQLFITVDCGISCAEEVEYLKELGAEVIVTDHHELPDKLPDCICINPKFNDGYIYDNLCGAGVAFKVGCALNGEKAYKYLDFAAIATIADSVPLTGENRDIVFAGLKIINSSPSPCYSQFLSKQDVVTAQTIAFTLAPKINAAGRMGDAKAALTLFNESDENKIFDLSAKLTAYNLERQKYCDELYLSAKEMIKSSDKIGKIILLCNENWNSGFVGIVAARLADEYSRPVILFVKNGDMLKGSARSIDSVNVFEALKACGQYISEFGGHSQAAGVNVTADNFDNLYNALENYMTERYTAEDFIPTVYINGLLTNEYSLKLVKELEMLEPCGVGNRRPMFMTEENSLNVRQLKPESPHLVIKNPKIELMFFGGFKYKKLLECSALKKLIFEYNVSVFRGKEYIKGFVRDIVYDGGECGNFNEEAAFSLIEALSFPKINCKETILSEQEINRLIAAKEEDTLFIVWDVETLQQFNCLGELSCELFMPSIKNFAPTVLVAPSTDADLSAYKKVVFLDNLPYGIRLASLENKNVYTCECKKPHECIKRLFCDREQLLKVYASLAANSENIIGANAEDVAKQNNLGEKLQVFFALKVFEQLKLIAFENGRLEVRRGLKSRLENSELYNMINEMQAD